MRTTISILLALATLLPPAMLVGGDRPPAPAPVTQMAAAVDAFAVDLYRQLADREGNLFFSPASLQFALGMLAAGARGRTAAELAAVCHWPDDPAAVHPGLHDLAAALRPRDPAHVTWESANRLWGQRGSPLLPSFRETVARWYDGGYEAVDFHADSEAARRTINHWVAQRTRDRIRDLLPPGTVDADTRLVLTNAVYFLADWLTAFPADRTREEPFHLAGGGTTPVPLMALSGRFPYAEIDLDGRRVQVLELPYAGGEVVMDVLLPAAPGDLPALERALSADDLRTWLAGLRRASVHCRLPRFTMTRRFFLRDTLAALGMATAFSRRSDLSGITGRRDLFVSDVIHKAFLKVDERGTEAAAATGITLKLTAVPHEEKTLEFRADRPFLLLIRHRPTGAILFMGRLAEPNA